MKVNVIPSGPPAERNLEQRDGLCLVDYGNKDGCRLKATKNLIAYVDTQDGVWVLTDELGHFYSAHRRNIYFENIRPIKGIDIRL